MRRGGISNMVATLILIAVTILGGVVVYATFTATVATQTPTAAIYIISIQANELGGGGAILTVSIKNSGTVAMTGLAITVDGDKLNCHGPSHSLCVVLPNNSPPGNQPTWIPSPASNAPLPAGSGASIAITMTQWSPGQQHIVTVEATGINGAFVTASGNVMVSSIPTSVAP